VSLRSVSLLGRQKRGSAGSTVCARNPARGEAPRTVDSCSAALDGVGNAAVGAPNAQPRRRTLHTLLEWTSRSTGRRRGRRDRNARGWSSAEHGDFGPLSFLSPSHAGGIGGESPSHQTPELPANRGEHRAAMWIAREATRADDRQAECDACSASLNSPEPSSWLHVIVVFVS
jgi:hypothetical protein